MVENDFILRGIQKLALVLAKMLGLKEDGKHAEFVELAETTALKEYNIAWAELLHMPLADFETWLLQDSISADKLDGLAQMLYLHAEPFTASTETFLSLQKILLVYDLLEQNYHWQSLENITRRKTINRFVADSL